MIGKDIQDRCEKVGEFWGSQMPMNAIEEMAELTTAISKFERMFVDGKDTDLTQYQMRKGAVVTELADVWISIIALMRYYDIPLEIVVNKMNEKLGKKY